MQPGWLRGTWEVDSWGVLEGYARWLMALRLDSALAACACLAHLPVAHQFGVAAATNSEGRRCQVFMLNKLPCLPACLPARPPVPQRRTCWYNVDASYQSCGVWRWYLQGGLQEDPYVSLREWALLPSIAAAGGTALLPGLASVACQTAGGIELSREGEHRKNTESNRAP